MGSLSGERHGDAANELMAFYQEQAEALEAAGQWFMSAVALALAAESALVAYLLVEFYDQRVSDRAGLADLISEANQYDVLTAPIDVPSHIREDGSLPKHLAKDVVDEVRRFRNLIHPAAALRHEFDPKNFDRAELEKYQAMYESLLHSLMYNL
jgi:hypothetical protein